MLLRLAEAGDFEAIRGLRESAADLPDAAGLAPDRQRFLLAARARHRLDIADPSEIWIVAESAAGVIAWLHAGVRSDGAGAAERDFTEIVMVFVRASERCHGVGRALLLDVEDRSRTRGVRLLRLVVHETNAGAVRLYRALGYVAGNGMMEKRLPGALPEKAC